MAAIDSNGVLATSATLGAVTDSLSALIVEVLAAPRGLDVPVAEAVIHDPAAPLAALPDDIVLGVGLGPQVRASIELIEEAAQLGVAAVVVKVAAEDEALEVAAQQHGVAVLRAHPETAWGQLHSLMRTAIAGAGELLRAGRNEAPAGDLFALANAVAAMVGGPVTIEDPQSRVLAYSSLEHTVDESRQQTILGRRVPEEWIDRLRREGIFSRLWSSDEVIQWDPGEGHMRMAVAVRAGGEILGSIWAADGGIPFHETAKAALAEAAPIAALHLVRHRVGDDLGRRMRGELLRSLLEGRGPLEVLAERLGIDPDTASTVVAFELQDGEEAEVAVRRERVLDLVATYCEAFRRRVAQVSMGRTIYALLPAATPNRPEAILRLANEVVERAEASLGVRVLAGIGSTVPRLREVAQSRAEADRVLRVLARQADRDTVASIDDVRSQVVLLELVELLRERPHMHSRKIQQLMEYDDQHDSAYVETLRAYLDCFGDVVEAARRVYVHPNTFRYRLRRVVELCELDLDDPDERLATELALRLS